MLQRASYVVVASQFVRTDVIDAYSIDPCTHRGRRSGPTRPAVCRAPPRRRCPLRTLPAQTWAHKNHLRLINTVALLKERGTRVRLVCTGHPNDRDGRRRRKHHEERGVADLVELRGYVDSAALARLYSEARCLVFPSEFEGFGFPVLEAFAAGVPVACSNTTSLPELAGNAALLFDPTYIDAIADALGRLWNGTRPSAPTSPLAVRSAPTATRGITSPDRAERSTTLPPPSTSTRAIERCSAPQVWVSVRVTLVALTTTGAGGRLRRCARHGARARATVGMWIPDRPSLHPDGVETHVVEKASTRSGVAGREMIAWVRPGSLAEEIRAWQPDVVHVVFGEGYPTVARACQQLVATGVTVAATWHDPKPHGQIFDRVQHAVAERTMRAASGVHVHCTELEPDGFTNVFVAELPAFPCPGCTVTTTQPLHTEGAITSVGRFAPYKGIDQLCSAAAEHWRRGGDRPLVVVGQGPVPPSLRRLERGWPSLVTVRNEYVSGAELHEVLASSAVCVMPYLSGTQSALPWLAGCTART